MSDGEDRRAQRARNMLAKTRKRGARFWEEAVLRGGHIETLIAERAAALGEGALIGQAPAPYAPIEIRDEAGGAPGTFVAFSSLHMPDGLVRPSFATFLKGRAKQTVFVKDFARKWFQNGLPPAASTRDDAVVFLERALADAPRPWRFIGNSAGGFGALFFGARLGADRIIAISPQTRITPDVYKRFQGPTPNDGAYEYDDPQNDIAETLAAHPLAGEAVLIFGGANRMDVEQARHVARFDRIALSPLPTRMHGGLAKWLIQSGQLTGFL